MEQIEEKNVDPDCDLTHFSAVVDLLIRRPHLIKSRKNFVAGSKILTQKVITNQDSKKDLRKDFQESNLKIEEENFSQQNLDYTESCLIVRKVIYKNQSQESSECLFWTLDDDQACLDVIPQHSDINGEQFVNTKAAFRVLFDLKQSKLKLFVELQSGGEENK